MPVPWARLALLAPTVLGLARDLLQPRQPQGPPLKDLEARLAAIQDTQRKEAEVMHALAEQTAALADAAAALRRQSRVILGVAIAGAVLAAIALAVALFR